MISGSSAKEIVVNIVVAAMAASIDADKIFLNIVKPPKWVVITKRSSSLFCLAFIRRAGLTLLNFAFL